MMDGSHQRPPHPIPPPQGGAEAHVPPPVPAEGARIGPNAILQLAHVLAATGGPALRDRVLAEARVTLPPPDAGMWPEADCRAVHLAVRRLLPGQADTLLWQAGLATGDYILTHRIPRGVQGLLRLLPGALSRRILARAIARNAWTFAGSGRFRIRAGTPLTVEIAGNPLAPAAHPGPACHWHVAVFTRLFGALTRGRVTVSEVACCASGAAACRFVIRPARRPATCKGGTCGTGASCGTHDCQ
jgi:divinyl protochlorophyllide a 8-vinyl-reductase